MNNGMTTNMVNKADQPCVRLLGAHMSISGGMERAIERAERVGASALQIFTKNQVQWRSPPLHEIEAARFRQQYAASALRFLCAHASYLINLASNNSAVREKSMDALVVELDRAEALGCDCLVLHPGAPKDDGAAVGLDRIGHGLNHALQATTGYRVKIAIENTAGQGSVLGSTMAQIEAILQRTDHHPRIAFCLDSCHAFAAGYDLRTDSGMQRLVSEVEDHIGVDRLLVLHLNDSHGECGTHLDRHQHIGAGMIGREGFRRLLRHPALKHVPGIIETPKDDELLTEDRQNLAVLRELGGNPRFSPPAFERA